MIKELQVRGVFAENCYFYIDDKTHTGFIIDPGAEPQKIYDTVIASGWTIEKILLTHGHFDHFGAAEYLSRQLGVPVYIYKDEAPYLSDTFLNLSANSGYPITIPHYEELNDGEFIRLGANSGFYLKVIHTPGHTPGSVTFYAPEDGVAFVGDLFYEHHAGLTHFPGGDSDTIENTIMVKIFTLPDYTVLLSGHSTPATVAQERKILLR